MSEQRGAGAPINREDGGKSIWMSLLQGVGIFIFTQAIISQFFGKKDASTSSGSGAIGKPNYNFNERAPIASIANYSAIPYNIAPIWPTDSTLDLQIYVSPSLTLAGSASSLDGTLVLDERAIKMDDYNGVREINTTLNIPAEVQHNGTLWAHFFLGLNGHTLNPLSKEFDPTTAVHFHRPLTQYLPKKRVRKLKNLLDKSEQVEEEPEEPQGLQIGSFYHPNLTVAIVPNTGIQNWRSMHPALRKNIVLEPTGARDATGQNGWYYPVVFLNTFWQLRSHMTELNDTVKEAPLNLQLKTLPNWQYSILASMDDSIKESQMRAADGNPLPGGGDGSELEKFKEILLDTNIYLLGTTFVVSILHMIFEALAFKNDIAHWRKKKDVIGTSVRTIIANVFMQTIIFLYLVDNSEGTSWMILASQGFGILLEAWKITKTVDVIVEPPAPGSKYSFLPYVVIFKDKHKLSETEQKTKEYDEIAFRYLYIVAVPLLLAYAAYSLVYETHKSWYSFVIETLVGSVYAYGFLMMVPSLYINYRLKSVAHMPARTMTYKFLNTFIDDLFAFTIRMPTLHRLATLRDDVIFFIWLYQKWKYRTDYTRKTLEGQDTKNVKASTPVAKATGARQKTGAKKRK
ncbi:hypothetical protein DV736_g2230, partial [Chaetothyriales sp. CBS 134916]